ncbi:rod shape-determining protein RodA [Nocardioides mangrovicus]|uniref:peptidoglycan glycosyltransferase n=1 Tax=Nocardioides mangrovicus TaxID=2478913 RepID=A0A3L8P3U0_9ACTN|nr:FtsW/RodA/SpoVE family cell cycle protein [Nocardioides mangrovicus]RLV49692.1 rod shape-determining protein RodA [Nocardioides mangrovicus]
MSLRGLDRALLLATGLLLVVGTLLVWSATSANEALTHGHPHSYVVKHVVNIGIGLVLGALVLVTDHRWVRILVPVVYLVSVVGLLLVLVMGSTINGSRSWLILGGLSLQPAELAKPAVVVAMALVLAERTEGRSIAGRAALPRMTGGRAALRALASRRVETTPQRTSTPDVGWREVALMLAIAGLPALLIIAQPDLGTLLVLSATVLGVLGVAGVGRRYLVGLAGLGVLAGVAAVTLHLLKPYQVDRFLAFTNPALDPRGAGYNTTQARIAIGNGGLFGQGLFHGSQTRAGFVPEQHTDFVFTVAGEELGLIGSALIIVLFGVLLWRALTISRKATDMFGRVAAAGIACWFGFQAFQNIGMCLGIMPVTGVPLPLMSYGGSSMFASLAAIGLLLNIGQRPAPAQDRHTSPPVYVSQGV